MLTKTFIIEFKSPYHVGWRKPEPIIDGLTVHRSLIALQSMVSTKELGELASELRVSAILPAVKKQNHYEPILPLPPLPAKVRPKKAGLEWMTLESAVKIAEEIATSERVIIEKVESGRAILKFGADIAFDMCVENRILKLCTETLGSLVSNPLEKFEAVYNRIDRITNSADLIKVNGYRARSDMIVLFQSESIKLLKTAEELLRLLGEIGVGGLRSRGFGKFIVKGEADFNREFFMKNSRIGYNLLLGSYVLDDSRVDLEKSYVNTRLLAGYSGPPHNPHTLPLLSIARAGSILKAKIPLEPVKKELKTASQGSLLVFNPVLIGC